MSSRPRTRFDRIFAATDTSRPYCFHSHTQFCDGRAAMADFAAEAASRGFSAYGFTPHSPVNIPSPCNMKAGDVAVYKAEFRRLKALYAGTLPLYCGMEIDYLGPEWGPHIPYFVDLGLDYAIGSVHFIPSPSGDMVDIDGRFASFARKMRDIFRGDIHGVVERYFEQSFRMVEAGGFDILGHADKVAHNASLYSPGIADTPRFTGSVRLLLRMAAGRGMAVEVNTKALDTKGRVFPDVRHMTLLRGLGVPLPVNSDAHVPALVEAGRSRAMALINQ